MCGRRGRWREEAEVTSECAVIEGALEKKLR
jgi:hypothetical protein